MRYLLFLVATLTLLLVAGPSRAAYTPPPRTGFVTDPATKVAPEAAAKISAKLAAYQQCSTNEIAVFLPTSLDGNTIEDVAYSTFNTWTLGVASKDNGVLLVIAPVERKAFIATGKGVGGELPDVTAFHILREHVTPNMKVGKTFAAVDEGTSAIGKALGGCAMTATAAPRPPPTSPTVLLIARLGYGAGVLLLVFSVLTALRGATTPKLVIAGLVTALYEALSVAMDPLDLGLLFVVPLLFANAFFWLRRAPAGSGGGTAGSAPWDGSSGSSGGGSSGGGGSYDGGGSSGGGGTTGGGGAGDSW